MTVRTLEPPAALEPPVPEPSAPERLSPLDAEHRALGAVFTGFNGWRMPVRYSSDLAEHRAVRQAAGLFDVSHMAVLEVSGTGAGALLDSALSVRISALQAGRAKYALLLTEGGGILDDLICYRLDAERHLLVANAGNREAVAACLRTLAEAAPGAIVADRSEDTAILALQGPHAEQILRATPGLLAGEPASLGFYRAREGVFVSGGRRHPVLVARTGYTGEDGFELLLDVEAGVALWRALLAAGTPLGLLPAGLAARDSLRLEAGMPLYGHELGLDVHPGRLPLAHALSLDEGRAFPGRAAVAAGPGHGARLLVGLAGHGRRAARAGHAVLREAGGEQIGRVSSGTLSPSLGHPIAMAFVDPELARPGTPVTVDVRGSAEPFRVTVLPFYRRPARRRLGALAPAGAGR